MFVLDERLGSVGHLQFLKEGSGGTRASLGVVLEVEAVLRENVQRLVLQVEAAGRELEGLLVLVSRSRTGGLCPPILDLGP